MSFRSCVKDCIKIELKNIFRIRSIKGIIGIILLYSLYIYGGYVSKYNDYWDILRSSSYSTIALMFGFMVLGFYLAKEEKEYNLDEIINCIYKGRLCKIVGKVFTIIILIMCFVILNITIIFIIYAVNDSPYILYKQSLIYHLIYFIIPFFIEALIGMIILYFKKKYNISTKRARSKWIMSHNTRYISIDIYYRSNG